ncbi:MAG: DUF222 domain-containing protein [Jatrophihabitans sp.]
MSESTTSGIGPCGAVFDQLTASVDALLAAQVTAEDDAALHRSLSLLAAQISRLQHGLMIRAAELNERRLPSELGFRGLPQFLQATLCCTSPAAKNLALAALRFSPRRGLSGQVLPPHFPAAAQAMASGEISTAHAQVIAEAVRQLPPATRAERGVEVEVALVAAATIRDPRTVQILATRIAAQLDAGGRAPDDSELRPQSRHRLHLSRRPDSSGELVGSLSPTCQALWETILAPLAAQRPVDSLGEDVRSHAQRMHDAFEEAGRLLLGSGELPSHAGAPTTLMVTIGLRELERRAGSATTHHGGALTVAEALRLAGEATLLPVVLDDAGGILSYGRGRRLASPGQRKALFARDRGCTFPDCTKPAASSEIHHATEWADGGLTDITTMVIACGYHNNEAPRQGWKTLMINGVAHWRPPRWRDPEQRPLRNLMHLPQQVINRAPATSVPPDG